MTGVQTCALPICSRAYRELLKRWLKKHSSPLSFPLSGQQGGHVVRGAQLPSSRSLAAAQFERLPEAHFCFFSTGERCGEQNIALHTQQLRQVAEFTICLHQQDGLERKSTRLNSSH